MSSNKENWGSQMGVILAVAGSAIGLGNFLRFPGQVAQYGGGGFMVAYFISLLIIGIPVAWAEWSMGRKAGLLGFHSAPGVFHCAWRHPMAKFLGVIGALVPVVIYMYYVYIEAWTLGYATMFITGNMDFANAKESGDFFDSFVGNKTDGTASLSWTFKSVLPYFFIVILMNFVLLWRGLSKGIETFCKFALPALFVIAFIVLIRVLTLGTPDPAHPERNVMNGLGYMWNTEKVELMKNVAPAGASAEWTLEERLVGDEPIAAAEARVAANPGQFEIQRTGIIQQLKNPTVWVAAASQIFFSLSVGFGVILVYASYLRRKDDVVLSGMSAASANEFAEVGLGGLITLPAAVAFLGIAEVAGKGTFGLGFNVLPLVFSEMPGGQFFGAAFFILLFLAAITSSLSMLQPGVALFQETLGWTRNKAVGFVAIFTLIGNVFVIWFSKDLKALDTLDFWVGTVLLFVLAMIQMVIFAWVNNLDKSIEEANEGAMMKIPGFFKPIMKYICPAFLLLVFGFWMVQNVLGINFATGKREWPSYIKDLFIEPNAVAWMCVMLIFAVILVFTVLVAFSKNYQTVRENESPEI